MSRDISSRKNRDNHQQKHLLTQKVSRLLIACDVRVGHQRFSRFHFNYCLHYLLVHERPSFEFPLSSSPRSVSLRALVRARRASASAALGDKLRAETGHPRRFTASSMPVVDPVVDSRTSSLGVACIIATQERLREVESM